ncbi:MAG: isochorismatase family cysteine hydrolase [Microbacter sp.]
MELTQELKDIVNPANTAFLLWDVQNMLVDNIFNKESFLTNSRKVLTAAREKNTAVFFSKIDPLPERFESPVRKYFAKHRVFQINFTPTGLDLALEPLANETVIRKNTASIFIGTNFEQMLRNAGISTIVMAGIATEIGIESSARDALNRGFFPVIVTDAVSSYNQAAHFRSLENMEHMMILLTSDELISLW